MRISQNDFRWWSQRIARMTHREMAEIQRFAPLGHKIFVIPELTALFNERFESLGGMTPEMSKLIGWN